jgi:hypothetical protein
VKHYDIVDWTDYVRGLAETSLASQMRQHLDAGCEKCARTAHTLQKMVGVIAAEATLDVPELVLHNALSIFSLGRTRKVPLTRLLAQLVFDSFRQPLPAGVRSRQRLSRHAMYEAGDFCVDLRLENERSAGKVNLVGQVGNRKAPESTIANVPVSLLSGHRVVAEAQSNEYGEFHLEYEPKRELWLQVPVKEDVAIEVRLNELCAEDAIPQDPLEAEDKTRRADEKK